MTTSFAQIRISATIFEKGNICILSLIRSFSRNSNQLVITILERSAYVRIVYMWGSANFQHTINNVTVNGTIALCIGMITAY